MREASTGNPAMVSPAELGGTRWYWANQPLDGPAVVFDLDGVLSDAAGRQHFIKRAKPDWEAFFAACGGDPLVAEVAKLLELLDRSLAVVLLTARPARTAELTTTWLDDHRVRWDLLVMRPDGDYRPARTFKQEAVRLLGSQGLDVKLCLEDDQRNVDMFRREGLSALYVHSGYYEPA